MTHDEQVTYKFKKPIGGTVARGGPAAAWSLSEVTFNFLRSDQEPPPRELIFNCHAALRDADGDEVPVEVLSLLDLEGGIKRAFQLNFGPAWDAAEAGRQ